MFPFVAGLNNPNLVASSDQVASETASSVSTSASDAPAIDIASLIRDLNSMEQQSSEDAFERQKELLSSMRISILLLQKRHLTDLLKLILPRFKDTLPI